MMIKPVKAKKEKDEAEREGVIVMMQKVLEILTLRAKEIRAKEQHQGFQRGPPP